MQNYKGDTGGSIDWSDGEVLGILFGSIAGLCLVTIVVFVGYRRWQMAQYALTETEERYVAVVQLRKAIRRAERKAQNDRANRAEHLAEKERLQEALDKLREEQVREFIDLLEVVESYKHSEEEF